MSEKQNPQPNLPGIDANPPILPDIAHALERGIFEHSLVQNGVGWSDQYTHLLTRGFTWRKAAVIAWLATPKNQRVPATRAELAKMMGCKTTTISKYEGAFDTQATIVALSQASLLQHLSAVDEALAQSAANPSYKNNQDRKTFYQRLGLLEERHRHIKSEATASSVAGMSEEELIRLAQFAGAEEEEIEVEVTELSGGEDE